MHCMACASFNSMDWACYLECSLFKWCKHLIQNCFDIMCKQSNAFYNSFIAKLRPFMLRSVTMKPPLTCWFSKYCCIADDETFHLHETLLNCVHFNVKMKPDFFVGKILQKNQFFKVQNWFTPMSSSFGKFVGSQCVRFPRISMNKSQGKWNVNCQNLACKLNDIFDWMFWTFQWENLFQQHYVALVLRRTQFTCKCT